MQRITKNELHSLAKMLARIMHKPENYFHVRCGNAYISWTLDIGDGGRSVLRANTARDLWNEMHAFKEGIYFMQENNSNGATK